MKKTLVILFSLLIPFNSHGGWEKVVKGSLGDTFYVDFNINKNNGNIYFWVLRDYLKPDSFGDMSSKVLKELDCNYPRKMRSISFSFYTQPMGKGPTSEINNETKKWTYFPPGTSANVYQTKVCDLANQ